MTNEISRKLKALRRGRKLTQQEAADRLGLTRATIGNYETGRRSPHISELERIGEFYGVGLDYFGFASKDEVFDLLSRAREVFNNNRISKEAKDDLYKELMKLYLNVK